MWWDAFDTEVTPERLHLVEPATAVAETTWRGTHGGAFMGIEPTGRSIAVPVILVADLRDGLMRGERIYWDRATVLEQLGRAFP
jgi:predicted ester cyclase